MVTQRIVHVVNRTCEQLEVMDDGVPWTIRPGYKRVEKLEEGQTGTPAVDEEGNVKYYLCGAGPGGTVALEPLPYWAAERAKRQNPQMGTEDPLNPTVFEPLVAVPDWGDDYGPVELSNAIERLDRSLMDPDAQKAVVIPGRGARRSTVKRGSNGRFIKAVAGARSESNVLLDNPAGMKIG